MIKSIEEADIKEGTRVLVRVDWNLPINENGEVADASRIEATLETIEYIKNKSGVPVIMSHFGREGESIEPVINFAKNNYEILKEGVEFLENLRQNPGEEENSEDFAHELAKNGEIYINEAFSVSHREHASIVSLPKLLPSFVGFNFLNEIANLSEAFNPEHPFLFILGGAKFETKFPLVNKFLNIADNIFIGGANAILVSKMDLVENPKIILPVGQLDALDANTETLALISEKINESKFILWNGPLGNYENGFVAGTVALARMIAESSAKVLVGGGDTLAMLSDDGIKEEILSHGFISTAGGAMLDFLANGTLPGIEALS